MPFLRFKKNHVWRNHNGHEKIQTNATPRQPQHETTAQAIPTAQATTTTGETKTMNNTLTEISNRLQKQVSDRAQAITDATAKLNPALIARRETADRLKAAQETGNPTAYAKAAEHHRTACDIVTMHEQRLEAIERKAAIDMATYQAAKAEIIGTMTQLNTTALSEALPLVDRLQTLRDELGADLDQGNRLLRTLQRDWFGDTNSREDYFKDYEFVSFINYMLDIPVLKSLRGRKQ